MNQNKRITVKDLARICGVSIGTVDRALNGRGRINAETKEKILAAADEYGYIKNQFARTLSSGSSNLIGVIVLNLRNEYFPALLTGIDAEAHERGFSTLFMTSGYSTEEEKACVSRMLSMNVAGIIVCSVLTDPAYYEKIAASGTPVIAVSNRIGGSIPYSGIDDFTAMHDAARHIAANGWEHICYISPALSKTGQNISAQAERAAGFRDAMSGAGISYDIIDTREALDSFEPPAGKRTALLCSSDSYTTRCIVRFRDRIEHGELGLMGFDNIASLRALYPELATVSYDACRIGMEAVRLLSGGEDDAIIPFEIVTGSTV